MKTCFTYFCNGAIHLNVMWHCVCDIFLSRLKSVSNYGLHLPITSDLRDENEHFYLFCFFVFVAVVAFVLVQIIIGMGVNLIYIFYV